MATLDEEMIPWLESNIESVDSEVVVRFIAKKGWNDKNFQVSTILLLYLGVTLTPILGIVQTIQPTRHVGRAMPFLWEVIGGIVYRPLDRQNG